MKRYRVTVKVFTFVEVEVEADNDIDASDLAEELAMARINDANTGFEAEAEDADLMEVLGA